MPTKCNCGSIRHTATHEPSKVAMGRSVSTAQPPGLMTQAKRSRPRPAAPAGGSSCALARPGKAPIGALNRGLTAIRNDLLGDAVERQDLAHAAHLYGDFGHTKHHAGGLVLGHSEGAGLVHLFHATRAIVAHARHDDAQRIAP